MRAGCQGVLLPMGQDCSSLIAGQHLIFNIEIVQSVPKWTFLGADGYTQYPFNPTFAIVLIYLNHVI